MKIEQTREGSVLTVTLEGRLDTITAPQLDAALSAALDDVTGLTLDCAGLEYISSAGLRVLLKTQKALHPRGGVTLTHVNETVAEVLDITVFSDFLTIV